MVLHHAATLTDEVDQPLAHGRAPGRTTVGEVVRVLVVGSRELERAGLIRVVELQDRVLAVAHGSSQTDVRRQIDEWGADVVLFGPSVPVAQLGSVIDTVRRIAPETRILWIAPERRLRLFERALAAGVHAIVDGSRDLSELGCALLALQRGYALLPIDVAERWASRERLPALGEAGAREIDRAIAILSKREREVLWWLGSGLSVKQTARKLFVSPRTVATHRDNIRGKLGLETAADVLRFAVKWVLSGAPRPEQASLVDR